MSTLKNTLDGSSEIGTASWWHVDPYPFSAFLEIIRVKFSGSVFMSLQCNICRFRYFRNPSWFHFILLIIGLSLRNTCLEWASDSYLLVQRQATFLCIPRSISGLLSAEGFESRSFCTYTYSCCTSNAPRCGVLAAETTTAASSHQQPTT